MSIHLEYNGTLINGLYNNKKILFFQNQYDQMQKRIGSVDLEKIIN